MNTNSYMSFRPNVKSIQHLLSATKTHKMKIKTIGAVMTLFTFFHRHSCCFWLRFWLRNWLWLWAWRLSLFRPVADWEDFIKDSALRTIEVEYGEGSCGVFEIDATEELCAVRWVPVEPDLFASGLLCLIYQVWSLILFYSVSFLQQMIIFQILQTHSQGLCQLFQ